jgi:Peptidase family M23
MKRLIALLVTALLFSTQIVYAATVYYWSTAYPLKNNDKSTMSQDIDKVHLWDGWLSSINYGQQFIRDTQLQVGGWSNQYRTFIKFDIEGLPKNPDLMALYIKSYARGDSSTTTPFAICKVGSSWNLSLTWNTQPSFPTCWGWYNTPTPGNWWGINLTSIYNEWKSGAFENNGVMMFPQNNNNNFDMFRSSRYSYGYGPVLRFDFTPTIELKMPLPGNHQWLVTTEPGGWDCTGDYDQYHDGTNYFSIDFSWRNVSDSGAVIYTASSNIPVLAASGGKVYQAAYSSSNGYYVVINHNNDGDISTGISTRYLHLKELPLVYAGQNVQQGTVLGYMGNTGISYGTHLHFGVRYQNSGSSNTVQLTKVLMDGRLLKGYQTECSVNEIGVPTDWNRYYRSYNTAY